MNLLRKKELKQGLRDVGLIYVLVISMVLAAFLIRAVKQELFTGGGKFSSGVEDLMNPPYYQD